MAMSALGGVHYPRSLGEFQAWFRTDEDCLDYLDWLRWPDGFVCPKCGHVGAWELADRRYECRECHERSSATAGTVFDKTRTPLTVWFMACWLFTSQKDGVSALSLKRALEIGSYQTAWAMLHRLCSVLVRPGRERLRGVVEVDETYIGGDEPVLAGGRAKCKKVLVGVAVELEEPKGFGRCRMAPIPDASGESLRRFLLENVEPGARVITDGWPAYPSATKDLYGHEPLKGASGAAASKLLPGVHKVSSLAKRWLLGTHQGSVDEAHLPAYLNEFVFRFNRRRSRSRGLVFYRVLELATAHDPVRFRDLIANPQADRRPFVPPGRRGRPPSLDRPRANRPWRNTTPHHSV